MKIVLRIIASIFSRISLIKQKLFYWKNEIVYINAKKDSPVIYPKMEINYLILPDEGDIEKFCINIKDLVKFKYYLNKGCKIYLAMHNKKIVGHYIISKISEYKPYLNINNPLFKGDNEYYIFYCRTFDEYQKSGIFSYMLTQICKNYIKTNEKIFISTDILNIASQKGIEKAGFKKLGVLEHNEIKHIIRRICLRKRHS